jgi:hypothetical protein
MLSIQTEHENTFIKLISNNNGKEFKSDDIIIFSELLKNDTLNAKMVFCGYGYHNMETGYDDFEGIDLKDKAVMIMTRNREIAIDSVEKDDYTNLEMTKLAHIFMSGAKAVILIPDPLNPDNTWFEMVKDYASQGIFQLDENEDKGTPGNIVLANTELADSILTESGKTLTEIQREINNSGKPNSFELKNIIAEIQFTKKTETVVGENIIAIVEGSDPVLKGECVVLSAHYDHVGVTRNGEINNGADDNGSGTVALLEVAEAFSKMKKKPRRSIVFAWVTAEEKGLIGSEYYIQNPVFPLKNTLANINLDMIGRSAAKELVKVEDSEKSLAGPNGIYVISGGQSLELLTISNKICHDLKLVPSDALSEEFMDGSDQYNFNKNGVPVLGITTGLHEDYHKPSDDFDKIDYHKMKRIADYTFLVAYEIANKKKRIVVDKSTEK